MRGVRSEGIGTKITQPEKSANPKDFLLSHDSSCLKKVRLTPFNNFPDYMVSRF